MVVALTEEEVDYKALLPELLVIESFNLSAKSPKVSKEPLRSVRLAEKSTNTQSRSVLHESTN